jgi:hypothetical protein
MSQNRVEPLIHTAGVRSAEEEREGWAFDIAKRVLPAIVHKEGYAPVFAAELAYEYADAFMRKASERMARLKKDQEGTRNDQESKGPMIGMPL